MRRPMKQAAEKAAKQFIEVVPSAPGMGLAGLIQPTGSAQRHGNTPKSDMKSPSEVAQAATLVDLLRLRSQDQRRENGFLFFMGDDQPEQWVRYGTLDRDARSIAVALQQIGLGSSQAASQSQLPSTRALILCPPGADYVRAFFGTLYAGGTAVTAYPIRANRRDDRLEAVVQDCKANVLFCSQDLLDRRDQIVQTMPSLAKVPWLCVEQALNAGKGLEANAKDWQPPATGTLTNTSSNGSDAVALLQYTSGSTSLPRGVQITHDNLMHNLLQTYHGFEITDDDAWNVTWLPPYHDMGLIGGLLQVLYAGISTYVMPPAAFVQRPIRWLEAISRLGARISGGPNFAYDLCVEKTTPSQREGLDLSQWRLAFNGAEPLSTETIDRFTDAFSPCGFRREAFFPCYGLAEATLMVSGGPREKNPVSVFAPVEATTEPNPTSTSKMPHTRTRQVVSCGEPLPGQTLRIVDPKTGKTCPDDELGEIWVAGKSISRGYFEREQLNEETFGGKLPDDPNSYLRTGDLGFFHDGELFVAGRLKDLIVVRGRNLYPNELEAVAQASDDAIRPAGVIAFASNVDGKRQLVIVAEIRRGQSTDNLASVVSHVRTAIADEFEVPVDAVALVSSGKIPKTSSGKPRRAECKQRFESRTLSPIHQWTASYAKRTSSSTATSKDHKPDALASKSKAISQSPNDIRDWLKRQLAERLEISASSVDTRRTFAQYGLDSVTAVQLAGELETHLDTRLPATLLYDSPTIESLVSHLTARPSVTAVSDENPRTGSPTRRPPHSAPARTSSPKTASPKTASATTPAAFQQKLSQSSALPVVYPAQTRQKNSGT